MSIREPTIRPYEPRDEESVEGLWRSAFPNDPPWNEPREVIERKRFVQPELFLVCELGGRVIGVQVLEDPRG